MSLGRVWRQELFRASAAALLAPGAVLAALVVLAVGGGFGALGSLGQAFAGPSLPLAKSTHALGGARSNRGHASAVLVALAPRRPAPSVTRSTAPAATTGPSPGHSTQPTGSSHHGGGSTGSGPPSNPGGPGSPGSPGTPGTPPPPTAPPPTSPPHPSTLIDGVVALGTSVTEKVPGPIGALATQTLKSVGQTLDGIIAPRTHAAP